MGSCPTAGSGGLPVRPPPPPRERASSFLHDNDNDDDDGLGALIYSVVVVSHVRTEGRRRSSSTFADGEKQKTKKRKKKHVKSLVSSFCSDPNREAPSCLASKRREHSEFAAKKRSRLRDEAAGEVKKKEIAGASSW